MSKLWTDTRACFWTGFTIRVAVAPFLLQWFHPDERQVLEFAHFHAHGRLHPFLESELHLRNQTIPWLFSWIIRLCDALGFDSPRAYMLCMHWIIGLTSWIIFFRIVKTLRTERGRAILGWSAALFWGFPFLYSRMLLEAISLPATFLIWIALQNRRPFLTGFWAGAAGALRYPSALWAPGASLAWFIKDRKNGLRSFALGLIGCGVALGLMGLADWKLYGHWMESAPAYWNFNRPGGPVAGQFGSDGLDVYLKWFEFLFTPWMAPLVIAVGAIGLLLDTELLAFCLPYIAGHLWTPHREPRFLLPLMPFLALAVARSAEAGRWKPFVTAWKRVPQGLRKAVVGVLLLHGLLQFAWYPLGIWAQLESGQGVLVRNYRLLEKEPARLLAWADPVIDALVPANVRWADPSCHWRRPPISIPGRVDESATPLYVERTASPDPTCERISSDFIAPMKGETLPRLLRVRPATLWLCPGSILSKLCP